MFLARKAKKVYGIEVVAEAIQDAKANAILNKLENLEFWAGQVEQVLPHLLEQGVRFEVATVDPPRSGCEAGVLKSLAESGVQRIVYVSCNPSTLARDLKILNELGYETKEIQPVDMFPQTYHTECVAKIEKTVRVWGIDGMPVKVGMIRAYLSTGWNLFEFKTSKEGLQRTSTKGGRIHINIGIINRQI